MLLFGDTFTVSLLPLGHKTITENVWDIFYYDFTETNYTNSDRNEF